MIYAILYTVLLNGVTYTLVEPVGSLPQCRAVAAVMYKNRDETFTDATCVGIIFDKS